jgi:HSP20 family molecular chaperone IbpA
MQPKPFHIFFGAPARTEGAWIPPADIYRMRDGGWIVKFDMAGVRPGDLDVRVSGCRVTVRGVRRDWLIEEGVTHYSMEISYNEFERAVEVPCDLTTAHWDFEFRHGVLLVRLSP